MSYISGSCPFLHTVPNSWSEAARKAHARRIHRVQYAFHDVGPREFENLKTSMLHVLSSNDESARTRMLISEILSCSDCSESLSEEDANRGGAVGGVGIDDGDLMDVTDVSYSSGSNTDTSDVESCWMGIGQDEDDQCDQDDDDQGLDREVL
jgi:hypothetical protein